MLDYVRQFRTHGVITMTVLTQKPKSQRVHLECSKKMKTRKEKTDLQITVNIKHEFDYKR